MERRPHRTPRCVASGARGRGGRTAVPRLHAVVQRLRPTLCSPGILVPAAPALSRPFLTAVCYWHFSHCLCCPSAWLCLRGHSTKSQGSSGPRHHTEDEGAAPRLLSAPPLPGGCGRLAGAAPVREAPTEQRCGRPGVGLPVTTKNEFTARCLPLACARPAPPRRPLQREPHPRECGLSAVLTRTPAQLVNDLLQREAGNRFRSGGVISWIGHTKARFRKWATEQGGFRRPHAVLERQTIVTSRHTPAWGPRQTLLCVSSPEPRAQLPARRTPPAGQSSV